MSGRSEPWRRTPQPLAQSAKDHPPQSLLSEQRHDAAEPTKNRAERCRAGASLGGEHPQPPRAKRERSSFSEPTQRPEARCRGAHKKPSGAVSGRSEPWRRTPQPLAQSAKDHPPQSLLSEQRHDAAEPTKNRAERCRAGASLGGEHPQPPRAKRERSSFPEPTQRPEARCRGAPTMTSE